MMDGVKKKHIPLRMCMACRVMKPKSELIRVVFRDGEVLIDEKSKIQQRGAYVCNCRKCLELLKKKRGLERAFRSNVNNEAYTLLDEYADKNHGGTDE